MPKKISQYSLQVSSAAEAGIYVAQRLKLARNIRHLSMESVASMLGISRKQLQNYENAESNISVGRLWELANIFDVEPEFFFDGMGHKKAYISNESLELIRLFSRIKDNHVKQALLGILREI